MGGLCCCGLRRSLTGSVCTVSHAVVTGRRRRSGPGRVALSRGTEALVVSLPPQEMLLGVILLLFLRSHCGSLLQPGQMTGLVVAVVVPETVQGGWAVEAVAVCTCSWLPWTPPLRWQHGGRPEPGLPLPLLRPSHPIPPGVGQLRVSAP